MADTRVQLIMSVVDRALGPLKRIADGAGGLAGRAKAASDAVKGLNSQVKSIDKFAKVSRDLAVTNNALQTARERTRRWPPNCAPPSNPPTPCAPPLPQRAAKPRA